MDIVERLKFDAARCEVSFSKGIAGNIIEAANEIELLRKTLAYYADQYCEGWCREAGGSFDDCGGCKARAVNGQLKDGGSDAAG